MRFQVHRFGQFLNENLAFNGNMFMPKIDPEKESDFDEEELRILKSKVLIENMLEEGSTYLLSSNSKDIDGNIYHVFYVTENNALWLLTNDNDGYNNDFRYEEDGQILEHPHLVIEVRNGSGERKTFYFDSNLSFLMRENPEDTFSEPYDAEETYNIIKDWPTDVRSTITEFAFDKRGIVHGKDIEYTNESVTLKPEEADLAEAFTKDNRETVADILRGDRHEYFNYRYRDFMDTYKSSYDLLNDQNLQLVKEEYQISNLQELKTAIEEREENGISLQKRLAYAYCRAQEFADGEECYREIVDAIERSLECDYVAGDYIFTHASFAKFIPKIRPTNMTISDLFGGHEISFTFSDNYHGSISKEDFNSEFVEAVDIV